MQYQQEVVEQLKDRLRTSIDAVLATPHHEMCEKLMRSVKAALLGARDHGTVRTLVQSMDQLGEEAGHDVVRILAHGWAPVLGRSRAGWTGGRGGVP